MKKKLTTIAMVAIILLFAARVQSQGFYATVGAGYGMSLAGNSNVGGYESKSTFTRTYTTTWDGSNYYYDNSGTGSGEEEIHKASTSFGKGVQVGATFGYMFNEHIGAELGFGYLIGSKLKNKYDYADYETDKYIDLTNPSNNTTNTTHYSSLTESDAKGSMFRIVPAIRLTAGNGLLKPYIRLGMVIGLANKVKTTSKDTDVNSIGVTTITEREYEYSKGISLGFAGGLGANYKFTDNIGMFAEIGVIAQGWAPKKRVYTKSTINGIDQLADMTTSEKETEYSKSYTYSYPNNNEGSPSKSLVNNFPFSSFGLNVGIAIAFGGK